MTLFRSKEERASRQAEIEDRDRDHSERLAAASAKARKGPIRCRRCRAWLPSTATHCEYCVSVNPDRIDPDRPPFTETVTADSAGTDAESEAVFSYAVAGRLRGIPGG
jgi:ribosomal protein L40E